MSTTRASEQAAPTGAVRSSSLDAGPDGVQDAGPYWPADTRRERRAGLARPAALAWVGPVPAVGRSVVQLRAAVAGRAIGYRRPAVAVDVLPVIRQRAAAGAWAARWATGAAVVDLAGGWAEVGCPLTRVTTELGELDEPAPEQDHGHDWAGADPPRLSVADVQSIRTPARGPSAERTWRSRRRAGPSTHSPPKDESARVRGPGALCSFSPAH